MDRRSADSNAESVFIQSIPVTAARAVLTLQLSRTEVLDFSETRRAVFRAIQGRRKKDFHKLRRTEFEPTLLCLMISVRSEIAEECRQKIATLFCNLLRDKRSDNILCPLYQVVKDMLWITKEAFVL